MRKDVHSVLKVRSSRNTSVIQNTADIVIRRPWLEKPGRLAFLLLLPAIIIIFGVLLYPMVSSLLMSFTRLNLANLSDRGFVGLANYAAALSNPSFRAALWRTLYFALMTVPVEISLGLGIALLLNQNFVGRGFVRGLIILPWALPYVVNGIMWKWIYDANYGALNALLSQLGLIDGYRIWLGDPVTAFHLVILANIWKETPVAVILILAALQAIPKELYEAATVDGARGFRSFWRITVPLLRPVLAVTAIVKTVWAVKEFDLIYIITRGGPADATNVVTYYTYLNTFKFLNVGYGSALAFILTIAALLLALVYVRVLSSENIEY